MGTVLRALQKPLRDPAQVIAEAMAFPIHDVTRRYAQDQGISPEVAQEHEAELKKYLTLCAMYPQLRFGMSRVIDDLWHTFICFTKKYHSFCEQIAGRYIHHEPTTDEEKCDGSARRAYLLTLNEYRRYFGDPPKHLWPTPSGEGLEATTCSGCTSCGGTGCDGSGCTSCK